LHALARVPAFRPFACARSRAPVSAVRTRILPVRAGVAWRVVFVAWRVLAVHARISQLEFSLHGAFLNHFSAASALSCGLADGPSPFLFNWCSPFHLNLFIFPLFAVVHSFLVHSFSTAMANPFDLNVRLEEDDDVDLNDPILKETPQMVTYYSVCLVFCLIFKARTCGNVSHFLSSFLDRVRFELAIR